LQKPQAYDHGGGKSIANSIHLYSLISDPDILWQIDFLSPTLVILGSRGRSAIKGVLLGSFSNYLVTKSSVPVMVARKKLRSKQAKTFRRANLRLSNVLQGPSSTRKLESAKIDKVMSRAD
jgi:hypothetical protein